MEELRLLSNSFSKSEPHAKGIDWELEELHKKPVSEHIGVQEGFLVMVSKLTEMVRLLVECISGGSASPLDECADLANEVHQYERVLTKALLAAHGEDDPLKALIRLPFQLERIGDRLEIILGCCRIRVTDGLDLNGRADSGLHQLLAVLLDVMNNLRDAFWKPDAVLLESIICECREVGEKLQELRLISWSPEQRGHSASQTTRTYLDSLDAIKSANEDLGKICASLMEFEGVLAASRGIGLTNGGV